MTFKHLLSALLFGSLATASSAEYKPYSIQPFEHLNGKWPETLAHGHHSSPITTRIMNWNTSPLAQGLMQGSNARFIGESGLEFRPIESEPHLSLLDKRGMNRERLGAKGGAIFQADFYFPEDLTTFPTMSILANATEGSSRAGYNFYRFGVDRDRVFFSFTDGKSAPDIYHRQSLDEFDLQVPGWHRMQLVFQGQNNIICAIDGQVTAFSPIKDDTLTDLEPGLMVTKGNSKDKIVYADNLQVLWTPDIRDQPPLTPWVERSSPLVQMSGLRGNPWDMGGLEWKTSASEAWSSSASEKKVIFVLFHDGDVAARETVVDILGSNEAVSVLTQCIPLRVDIQASSGASIAQRYQINQFPTVGVIDHNGNLGNKVYIAPKSGMTWNHVFSQLKGS